MFKWFYLITLTIFCKLYKGLAIIFLLALHMGCQHLLLTLQRDCHHLLLALHKDCHHL